MGFPRSARARASCHHTRVLDNDQLELQTWWWGGRERDAARRSLWMLMLIPQGFDFRSACELSHQLHFTTQHGIRTLPSSVAPSVSPVETVSGSTPSGRAMGD